MNRRSFLYVVGSLPELDATTAEPNTKLSLPGRGDYWYRYNHDNYGEDANGFGWTGDGEWLSTTPSSMPAVRTGTWTIWLHGPLGTLTWATSTSAADSSRAARQDSAGADSHT